MTNKYEAEYEGFWSQTAAKHTDIIIEIVEPILVLKNKAYPYRNKLKI